MKRKPIKLAAEIHELQFVRAADICGRGAHSLCIATHETINKQIFVNSFQSISAEKLFLEKVFGIN